MKRMIFIVATLLGLGCLPGAVAQEVKNITPGVSVSRFKMERNRGGIESCRVAHASFGQRDGFARPAIGGNLRAQAVLLLREKWREHDFG